MNTSQQTKPARLPLFIVWLFLAACLGGQVLGQVEGDAAPKTGDSVLRTPAANQPFTGEFTGKELKVTIKQAGADCSGTILKAGKPFDFMGKVEGDLLQGSITVGGAKSNFTARLEGDDLTMTMGFNSYKLSRRALTPVRPGSKLALKKTLLAKAEDILVGTELASPDNRRVAFVVLRDGQRRAVVNGVEGQGYRRVGGLVFSPDSQRLAYIAKRDDGKVLVIVDEKEGEGFEALGAGLPLFSPDSKRVAYAALRDDKWFVIVNGEAGQPFESIATIAFSPDSKRLAFAARKDGAWRVVVDGVEHEPVTDIVKSQIIFSDDSKQVAYSAIKDGRACIVVDGLAGKSYDGISGFGFSHNSKHTAYIAFRDREMVLVVDGVERATYERIHGLSMGPKGDRLVVGARRNLESFYVIDGHEQPLYEAVKVPYFSSTGQIAYPAQREGRWRVIIDGKDVGRTYDDILDLAFSPDGRRLACVAAEGSKYAVFIDGETLATFDQIGNAAVTFSPDSRHLVVGARRDGKPVLFVNGGEGEPMDEVISGSTIVFDEADHFHIITRNGGEFYKLDARIGN